MIHQDPLEVLGADEEHAPRHAEVFVVDGVVDEPLHVALFEDAAHAVHVAPFEVIAAVGGGDEHDPSGS